MAIHIIPEYEEDLHIEDADCNCQPMLKMDDESGEMVWIHEMLEVERLIDNLTSF